MLVRKRPVQLVVHALLEKYLTFSDLILIFDPTGQRMAAHFQFFEAKFIEHVIF